MINDLDQREQQERTALWVAS